MVRVRPVVTLHSACMRSEFRHATHQPMLLHYQVFLLSEAVR